MTRRRTALVALVAALACGGEPAPAPGPPAAVHGAVVLEPSVLGVGERVDVAITVVTPPDHRVRPVDLPEPIEPLWLLDAEALPVARDGERWTHVTRVRARVKRAPGEYAWPPVRVEVEGPDGEVQQLVLEGRPFTVASASDRLPDRLEPFGLRTPPAEPGAAGGRLMAALLGAGATLLAVGGVAWARRVRARRRDAEPADDPRPAWTAADAELAAALAGLDTAPDAAADRAAVALRRYVHQRTRRPVEAHTTEEIAAQRPPGRLRSRWPELVDLLRRIDALRFPGELAHAEGREALRAVLEDARRFVADSIPPRELR